MDDLSLTTAFLADKTKEELIALLQAREPARAEPPSTEFSNDLEDVIHALFDDSMIPMIMVDETGRFRRTNRAFKDLTGHEDADLLLQTIGHNTHPDDRREVENLRNGLQDGRPIPQALDKRIVCKDGSILNCKIRRLIIRDQKGAVKFMVSEIIDLTDQLRQTQELQRHRTLFEAVFWDMADALLFVNPDRTIRMYNSACARLFGFNEHEMIGKSTLTNYADPEEFERQGRLHYNTDASGRIEPHTEMFRRKDGSVFAGETIGTIVRDEDGTLIGFMGLVRDVTDRDKSHRALVESERRFQDFAQAGAYRFWETDVEGRYTYLSRANKYFPNSEELLIGRYQYRSPNFH